MRHEYLTAVTILR